MNEKELRELVDKFYNGLTSREEEQTLRDYFHGSNIYPGFETEKAIFGYYSEAVEIPEPSDDFEMRIITGIERSYKNRSGSVVRRVLPWMSMAASILLVAGSYFYFKQNEGLKDTYSDPKIAYNETRKILYEVSSKMNKAEQVMQPIGKMQSATASSLKTLNKSTRIIEKNLKSVDFLVKDVEIKNNK